MKTIHEVVKKERYILLTGGGAGWSTMISGPFFPPKVGTAAVKAISATKTTKNLIFINFILVLSLSKPRKRMNCKETNPFLYSRNFVRSGSFLDNQ